MSYTAMVTTAAPVTPTRIDNLAGTSGVAGGAGTGLKFFNTGQETMTVRNSGVGTPSFVILCSGLLNGKALDESNDITQATAAGTIHYVGRLDPEVYNDPDGYVRMYFTGSNETDLKIVVWRNG